MDTDKPIVGTATKVRIYLRGQRRFIEIENVMLPVESTVPGTLQFKAINGNTTLVPIANIDFVTYSEDESWDIPEFMRQD